MRILITGTTGFVGQALISHLCTRNYSIRAAVRQLSSALPSSVEQCVIGSLSSFINWAEALKEVDTIVHCAARAHIMNDSVTDPLTEFRQVNTAGTLNLARQAVDAGVNRFIFISSIKVNGELTEGTPFSPEDKFIPSDPYGLSKYEAEQ
ncbi:MAG: NAD-dependent epimerase/dehydratase family protein, partial [Methylococcales bacterium]|nr:NAD-dependent epimerase/dehydratase family protein [Methylococcales bacterium]